MSKAKASDSDKKEFGSNKIPKMELLQAPNHPGTPVKEEKTPRNQPPQRQNINSLKNDTRERKRSNLTLNMGLIENYEPEHINLDKIETQKKRAEQLSAQGKKTNGKNSHTN